MTTEGPDKSGYGEPLSGTVFWPARPKVAWPSSTTWLRTGQACRWQPGHVLSHRMASPATGIVWIIDPSEPSDTLHRIQA